MNTCGSSGWLHAGGSDAQAVMARLDRDGLVTSEWVESDQGPPRKYYGLTLSGRQLFDQLSEELELLVSLVKQKQKLNVPVESEYTGKTLLVRKA